MIKEIIRKANEAGRQAAQAKKPTPMIVTQRINPLDDSSAVVQRWYEPSGACGFAWVSVKGLRGKKRAEAIEAGFRKDHYSGGLTYWVSDYGQSIELKEAHANAMAEYLTNNGIKAYAGSRLD